MIKWFKNRFKNETAKARIWLNTYAGVHTYVVDFKRAGWFTMWEKVGEFWCLSGDRNRKKALEDAQKCYEQILKEQPGTIIAYAEVKKEL